MAAPKKSHPVPGKANDEKATPKATKCPISREQFQAAAKPMLLSLTGGVIPEGERVALAVGVSQHKDPETGEIVFGFSTGSFGWGTSDKITVVVGGIPLKVQASVNLTVVNSKEV